MQYNPENKSTIDDLIDLTVREVGFKLDHQVMMEIITRIN